jgi:hypothetical protein
MSESNDSVLKILGPGLAGLAAAGVYACVYAAADWLDPNAAPYAHTIVSGIVAAILLAALWQARRALAHARVRRARRNVPKAKGDRLCIVVAALKGDSDGTIARRVVLSLREELGHRVEVIPVGETIVPGKQGSDDVRELVARKAGQDLLTRTCGDVLIWGEALREERVVDLNFLARKNGSSGTHSYALSPTMRLPVAFSRYLGTALAAHAKSLLERHGRDARA